MPDSSPAEGCDAGYKDRRNCPCCQRAEGRGLVQAERITQTLVDEGWTCFSSAVDEAEFLPVSVLAAVRRVLTIAEADRG